jgi:beta-N-acetylhexosaminidase
LRQTQNQPGRVGAVPASRRGATDKRPPTPAIEKLVGQRFMVGLRGIAVQSALLEDARKGTIGGIVLFPEGAGEAEVGQVVAELQAAARQGGNPPLLIATDQEGGPVKRFPQGPPSRPLSGTRPGQALTEGERTGSFLGEMGINTNLAPVVDLGLPASFIAQEGRTISADPRKVSVIGNAFVAGLQQPHTLAVAKHFPGLGSAAVNTDLQRTEVAAGIGQSLQPFRELIRGGVKGVMVSTASYRSLDPAHGAAWSRKIVTGLLRKKLGFDDLIFSDDLSTDGVHEWMSTPAAAKAALKAGVDVLIIGEPNSFRPAFRAAVKAAEEGDLTPRQLEDSYRRIKTEKEWMK